MNTNNTKQRCPYCLGTNLRNKGRSRKAKRRMKCQDCKKHITQGGRKWFVSSDQIKLINKLLLERVALRSICRIVEISLSWVLQYIKKLYGKSPDDLNYRNADKMNIQLQLIDTELGEMWSFVQNKKTNNGFGLPYVEQHVR